MAEKTVFLLENKKIAKEFGDQGRLFVNSRFTLDQMMDKLEELYFSLVKEANLEREVLITHKYQAPAPLTRADTILRQK